MPRRLASIAALLALGTLLSLGPLIVWDVAPALFPPRAHDVLASLPLALVAVSYLVYQGVRRVSAREFAKATLSALAFIFWALNQLWPDRPQATLFNDIAIIAFVLDVLLVIFGWPPVREDHRPGIAGQDPLPSGRIEFD